MMKATRLLGRIKKQHFATYCPPDVHRTCLTNGLKLCCVNPTGGDLACCTIMFQVGSRHEFDDSLGATHFLRAASYTSGKNNTAFNIARSLQQVGGYITCSSDRQCIAYTLRCAWPDFDSLKHSLVETALRKEYHDHELDDVRDLVRTELLDLPRETLAIDLVQKACFGGALSNSIFCIPERIDSIDASALNAFFGRNFEVKNCTIASINVQSDEMMRLAADVSNQMVKPSFKKTFYQPTSCTRCGFEYQDLGPGGDTYVALGVPACGSYQLRTCLSFAVLAAACGFENTQQGGHEWDRMQNEPIGSIMGCDDPHTDFRAFNVSYIDTGVFGVLVKSRANIRAAAFSAAKFLKGLGQIITPELVEVGKKRLKLALFYNDDVCDRMTYGLALQMSCDCVPGNAMAMAEQVNLLSAECVIAAANMIQDKCGKGQMGVAVVGDVATAPHDRELQLC